ncbi:MAG: P1 family peptidase, partial [Paracoccaceae bacterium]|nr:P1 family peptidase [Paracoccaceae bacterium]
MRPGPRNLITDVTGLRVGNASNAGLKSGTTVLLGDRPFVASVHVMGGAPGTRETDLLAPDKSVVDIDALVLSGGSAFGLDACSGVVDGLRAMGRGLPVGRVRVPIVPGAILFDLLNGGNKGWTDNPYRALGRAALEAAHQDFELGSHGAGTGALSAMWKGGLGSASFVLPSGETVGALVAANPVGSVTTTGSRHFWAAPFEVGDEFGGLGSDVRSGLSLPEASRKMAAMGVAQGNTTIAIVATDAPLTKAQCQRLAVAAHD